MKEYKIVIDDKDIKLLKDNKEIYCITPFEDKVIFNLAIISQLRSLMDELKYIELIINDRNMPKTKKIQILKRKDIFPGMQPGKDSNIYLGLTNSEGKEIEYAIFGQITERIYYQSGDLESCLEQLNLRHEKWTDLENQKMYKEQT